MIIDFVNLMKNKNGSSRKIPVLSKRCKEGHTCPYFASRGVPKKMGKTAKPFHRQKRSLQTNNLNKNENKKQ